MLLQVLRFVSLILTAIGLSMGVAHVLELPPRMQYDGELYMAVSSTLYRMYAIAGAIAQLGSIVAVAALCYLSRGRRSFTPTLLALLALILSMILWATIVQPVNIRWANALQTDPAPAIYRVTVADAAGQLRTGWVRLGSYYWGISGPLDVRWDAESKATMETHNDER